MPIPTYDEMLGPLLDLASKGPLTRSSGTLAMEKHFSLSEEERAQRIPSGQSTYIKNRVGWAMTFLTKAGLIHKIAHKTYEASERGHTFLSTHPGGPTLHDLRRMDGWTEAWQSSKRERSDEAAVDAVPNGAATPAESLDAALTAINDDVKARLMESVLHQDPTFFEQLVLDVLVAMGYGGSRLEAAQHLGRGGDEGIDGRINQDPLGLDQILVQAKRYAVDRPVDRQTVQAFIGSMAGQGVTKGVFITTSTFNENAREFVLRGSSANVVLIDGDALLNLMLKHHIGVRVTRTVEVLELDQNYFSDDE